MKSLAVVFLFGMVLLLANIHFPGIVGAGSLTVNDTGDERDSFLADDICDTEHRPDRTPAIPPSGICTLRAAIEQANTFDQPTTISFDIPGDPPHLIQPRTVLPTITNPVNIDGALEVVLDGTDCLICPEAVIKITAGDSTVRRVVFQRLSTAIQLEDAGGNLIEGNVVGADPTGSELLGGGGLLIFNSPDNRVTGNLIAGGNLRIQGASASGNVLEDNKVGTNLEGSQLLGGGSILVLDGPRNTIGPGNVVAGGAINLSISGKPAVENVIKGNFIGTDVTGTQALGDSVTGMKLFGADDTVIGGTSAGDGKRDIRWQRAGPGNRRFGDPGAGELHRYRRDWDPPLGQHTV